MTFDEWLSSTQQNRDQLAYQGLKGLGVSNSDMAIELIHEAEKYRDQAKDFLIQAKALAMFAARRDHPELNSREREIVEKDAVRSIQIIVDACETTVSSLTKRYFSGRTR